MGPIEQATDLQQVLCTHNYQEGSLLSHPAKDDGGWPPNHFGRPPSSVEPSFGSTDLPLPCGSWSLVSKVGFTSFGRQFSSQAPWHPSINVRRQGAPLRTNHQVGRTLKPAKRERPRALLILCLQEGDCKGIVQEKCWSAGTLLPACTSTDAATFFGIK